ncbi:flagellar protein [Buchnera aphidicola (Nipponaphis monzeni)]|uniref:Flagellar protein n=1 Tax=Buchnera aphidicola (Nipponaphis monzeni) TaxID=2495405 RepID=A0A455TAE2_9GAMM|nr:rod-binding protein [Buchnera aphidicola]BBI01275.1 flagellar protein [Buchnera aphidicola (Nipponaphis monzeni)]
MKTNSILNYNQKNNFEKNNLIVNNINQEKKIYTNKLSQAVESIFINILIKTMRKSLLQSNIFNNDQVHLYTEIYDEQISKTLSTKGIGLSKIIQKQINVFKNS